MCRFELETCPFPHHDPVGALIFLPKNATLWKQCDKPKPWGRLSCGNLIVEHPVYAKSHPEISLLADCKWCTQILKLEATKSKEIQSEAHKEIAKLEKRLNADSEMKQMKMDIEALEQRLARLRADFFGTRLAKRIDYGKDKDGWEKVEAER